MQGNKKGRNFFLKKNLSFDFNFKLKFSIRMKETCVCGHEMRGGVSLLSRRVGCLLCCGGERVAGNWE